jgi:small subunit ribosomal protein S1
MLSDHDNPTTPSSFAAAAAPAQEVEPGAQAENPKSPAPIETAQEASPAPLAAEPAPEPAPAQAGADAPADVSAAAEAAADAEDSGDSKESQEMSELIEQLAAESPQLAPEGEIVTGKVVAYTELGVVVDLGTKSEGLILAEEFLETDVARPEPGASIEVQLTGDRKEGMVVLAYQRVLRKRVWERVEAAYKAHETLTGKIVDRIKGGLVVDIGVRAFLPGSQYDVRPTPNLESLTGQELPVRITKLNRKRGNVVVSRRAILEEELQAKRVALMDSLSEGQVLIGKVKNITDYGVFVDLGGLDGLLHITDLSWARIKHPSEEVATGDEMEVQVLKFDKEKMRVSLGRKQLLPDPWATVPERYPAGTKTRGKVVGIADYGAFVELETGVEGLVHITEMSWSKRMQHPSKLVKNGDEVDVVVLDVKPDQRRVSLGIKQTQPDPWQTLAEKYPVGTTVNGKVRNLTEFGAFVEIEEGFDGLIHVSDISWTGRVKNPSDHFKKGDAVTAKVLKIDTANRRVSLGVKQVNDIWAHFFEEHAVGTLARGKVTRMATFGAFVELAEGIEGLCHISEIEDKRHKSDGGEKSFGRGPATAKGGAHLEVDKEYDFKIVKINREQHKIGLSFRAAVKQAERRDMDEYRSSKSSPTATIGDAILSKRESL